MSWPKKSFFSLAKRSFGFWFGGIWLFCGAPFLIIGIYTGIKTMYEEERFQKESRMATGMVLTKSITTDSKNSSKHYGVTFRFTTPDIKNKNGNATVSMELWDRLEERGPINIVYVPGEPRLFRVEGNKANWMFPAIFSLLGMVFVPIGGFIFFKSVAQIWQASRLRERGMQTEGTVIEVGPGNVSMNGVPQWVVRFKYRDHQGLTHEGESDPLPPEEAQAWQAGDKGSVRYNFRSPRESVWLGKGQG
jgi:hypothetical protein